MDWTNIIPIILTFGIFLIAFLSFLLVGFQAMLNPIKDNQAKLESEMTKLESEMTKLKSEMKDVKANLVSILKIMNNVIKGSEKGK